MDIKSAINREINFFIIAIPAIIGLRSLFEIIEEEGIDKFDDVLFVFVTLIGIVWYLTNRKLNKQNLIPAYLLGANIVTKFLGIIVEQEGFKITDPDISFIVVLAITLGIFLWQFFKNKKFG